MTEKDKKNVAYDFFNTKKLYNNEEEEKIELAKAIIDLKDVHKTPYWVKTKKDALKYASHLQFRLKELSAITTALAMLLDQEKENEAFWIENDIRTIYQKAYDTIAPKELTFDEFNE